MRYNRLGKTGLFVSQFCLGTMTFGVPEARYAAAGSLSREDVEPIMRRALDAGINFIDTADVYSGGQSEEIVGGVLKTLGVARHDVVLATKAEHAVGPGPNDGGASRSHLMRQVEASLKRLGTDHIDLYQMHGWDAATPAEETVRALEDLVRRGSIRYVGVSNWAAWQVEKALGIADRLGAARFQCVQAYYSLVGRDIEREIVPMIEAEGLALMVYSPLAGGFLTGKYRTSDARGRRAHVAFPPVDEARGAPVLDAMDAIAAAHGTSMASLALAWLLRKEVVTSVIVGLTRLEQLDANLAASEIRLTDAEVDTLDAASALAPEYPAWMAAADSARQALLATGRLA